MKAPGPKCLPWLVLLVLGLSTLSGFAQEEEEKEPVNLPRERSEWFREQRAWPHASIPRGARQNSIDQLNRVIAAEAARAPRPSAKAGAAYVPSPSATAWVSIGPQPASATSSVVGLVGGRVTALAVDPNNANIVYLGAAQGGIWKSLDAGTTWVPLTDTQASLAIGSIAIDPSNSQIIYVGTGEENFSADSYYGAGVLKSTDGGNTWTQLGQSSFVGNFNSSSIGGAKIGSIAVSPSNNQVLLAGVYIFSNSTTPGIYRSTNGGISWTNVRSGAPVTNVVFDPTNGSIAYASMGSTGTNGSNGIYKSTDGGANWNFLVGLTNVLPPGASLGRTEIALAPSNPSTIYASVANASASSNDILAFAVSNDSGQTWTVRSSAPNYCTPQCWYDNVIRVQPGNPNVVYAGGAASNTSGTSILWRSTDAGLTWSEVSSGGAGTPRLHVDTHAIAFTADGSKVYVGNDGGVWSTTNVTVSPVNWTNLNQTLATLQIYPGMAVDVNNANAAIVGTQDNGTIKFSGTSSWQGVTCGDAGWSAIDNAGTTYYSACQRVDIRKSTSSGSSGTWSSGNVSGLNPPSARQRFIPSLVMDPTNNQVLYFGADALYQTTNGAQSWQAISGDLTNGSSTIMSIAVAPNDSNTVYVGTGDGKVQVSTNALQGVTSTWTDRTLGLPGRAITHIAVSPTNAQTAYVSLSGFTVNVEPSGHIFRTTNGGANWTDVTGTLEPLNTPVNDIVIDPDFDNVLYAATDVGVFRTLDGGTTWNTLLTGLPRVAVLSLNLHRASRKLRAGTHGRSAWDLVVAPVAYAAPASLAFAARDVNTTSNSQSVTVTNYGNLPLTITAVNASAEYAQTNNCVTTLAVGNSCSISTTFTPAASGTRTGSLTITANVPGGSATIPLSGIGISPIVLSLPGASQVTVPFGNVLEMSLATLPVTVTNNGSAAVHILAVSSPGGDFAQTNGCVGTLAVGASCTVTVTLLPSSMGPRSGIFTITDDAGTGTQTVIVNGTGVDLALALSRIGRPARSSANNMTSNSAAKVDAETSGAGWLDFVAVPMMVVDWSAADSAECSEKSKKNGLGKENVDVASRRKCDPLK